MTLVPVLVLTLFLASCNGVYPQVSTNTAEPVVSEVKQVAQPTLNDPLRCNQKSYLTQEGTRLPKQKLISISSMITPMAVLLTQTGPTGNFQGLYVERMVGSNKDMHFYLPGGCLALFLVDSKGVTTVITLGSFDGEWWFTSLETEPEGKVYSLDNPRMVFDHKGGFAMSFNEPSSFFSETRTR